MCIRDSRNTGEPDKNILLKGCLDKYRAGLWPFRTGELKYTFHAPVNDQNGILKMENNMNFTKGMGCMTSKMYISKYHHLGWKEIGKIGTTRQGYNVFDIGGSKIFKIRKVWKFMNLSQVTTYSVRKVVLKNDILGSGNGTIEIEPHVYPEPVKFKLHYSPSPGDFEEISLLVAVLYKMLIDSMITF